jgi:PAS domain S-box-containing protein
MENDLSSIINALPGVVWTAFPDGQIDSFSQRWCDYTGLSADECRAQRWHAAIHPDDSPGFFDHWRSILSSGKPGEIEARLRRFDGVYRWFLVCLSPLADNTGQVVKWCGINTDIHERKRAEDVARANEELERKVAESKQIEERLLESESALQKAFDEIKKSEAKLRRVIDTIPTLAWCNLADGPNEFLNKGWHEYTGLSPEDSHGWGWQAAFHPEDLPPLLKKWGDLLASGEAGEIEARLRRYDGVYRWFLVRVEPFLDDAGRIARWYGTSTDIEDRKRAEAALKARESELSLIVNTIPALAWSARPDGYAEFYNQHFMDYVGLPLERLQGWGWTGVVHPDDLSALADSWQSIMAAGKPGETEARLRRFDGEYRWFLFRANPLRDVSGNIVKWYGTNTDIEDRKRAEEAVRASEAQLRQTVDTIPGLVCTMSLSGEITTLNKQLLEYFGKAPEELKNWKMTDAVHPDDLSRVLTAYDFSIRTGTPYEVEHRCRRADGVYRWFQVRALPVQDKDGQSAGWYVLLTDIEDRKRTEEELRHRDAELAHASRVVSLGVLAASIAHEVNQPLTGIITNAGTCLRMLSADPPNVEGACETARRAIRDGNRAAEVIIRLRTLFSKREPTTEPVDLNEATREVIALSLSRLQRDQVILRQELANELPAVTGDRVQLQQVILNLVLNASDAMSGVEDRPRELLVRTERAEGGARLTVQDAGIGIQPEIVGKLFEPFHTTKASGMGIGLSVSRSIIESHHGRIWAAPNDGPGATFSFSIPGL